MDMADALGIIKALAELEDRIVKLEAFVAARRKSNSSKFEDRDEYAEAQAREAESRLP